MKCWRALSLVLAICVLFCALSSCTPLYYLAQHFDGAGEAAPSVPEDSNGNGPFFESDPREPNKKDELAYTLTQKELDALYQMLSSCEAVFLGEAREASELQSVIDKLEAAYDHLITQKQIAYIYYCVNRSSEQMSGNYLFASGAAADFYSAYIDMCRRIDESSSPNRAFFFEDWTEDELEEMRAFSEEQVAYTKANAELLIEYRALSESDFYDGAARCFLQFIHNNNAIAALSGYTNYWDYASQGYGRSYSAEEMKQMRSYIKTRVVSMWEDAVTKMQALYAALSKEQKSLFDRIVYSDYDLLDENYLEGYASTFDADTKNMLLDMLNEENSVFTSSEDSLEGAFTVYLYEYERPMCYFGNGCQDLFTLAHEMGHYHTVAEKGDADIPLDLAEVHSQSNELLLLAYLEKNSSDPVWQAIRFYLIANMLETIIISTVVDEFEELCYKSSPSLRQLDILMEQVVQEYGSWSVNKNYACLYWRYVVLESPVYYLSYAVSALAALQVYAKALTSFKTGKTAYLTLVESAANGEDYPKALAAAGLTSPTELQTYYAISRLIYQN